jgi:hypothetical protein
MSIEVRQRPNRFRRRPVASVVLTVASVLLVIEIGLRAWSPAALVFAHSWRQVLRYHDRWYVDFLPGTSSTVRWRNRRGVHVLNFVITVGRHGFRTFDRELESRPSPGARRRFVHAIGDSFTMGWGVSFDTSYPAVLDFLLPRDDRVLNLGLAGFGTIGATEKSRLLSESLPPAAAVYVFHANDYGDDARAVRWAQLPWIVHRAADVLNGLRRHTYLANLPFAIVWWLHLRTDLDVGEAEFRSEKVSAWSPQAFQVVPANDAPSDPAAGAASKEAMLGYARFLKERGVPLIVIALTPSGNTRDFNAFCSENGIEFLQLKTPEEFRLVSDGHLNQLGNHKLALFVRDLLAKRGIVGAQSNADEGS